MLQILLFRLCSYTIYVNISPPVFQKHALKNVWKIEKMLKGTYSTILIVMLKHIQPGQYLQNDADQKKTSYPFKEHLP